MMGELCQIMECISELLLAEFKQSTSATPTNLLEVSERLAQEVLRICQESKRIQASGEVEQWAKNLAQHRLRQCLHYYRLGSRQGRIELHSTLSSIIYRYITPPQVQSSYQARISLIEDFLQQFYLESLNVFRRETGLAPTYSPKTLLELAEYMAFTERYGKRRIPLSGGRSQQLIVLRAQTFSQQQPKETSVDMDQAAEGGMNESESNWGDGSLQQVRVTMVEQEQHQDNDSLREIVIKELMAYLQDNKQQDCADYFTLRLKDLPTNEIETILGLTPRQRDYLQQRFKYHLLKFALGHRWELVHQWLEADLEKNLGLTPKEWENLQANLPPPDLMLLELKQARLTDEAIGKKLNCKPSQVKRLWFQILETAWEIRNHTGSGSEVLSDE